MNIIPKETAKCNTEKLAWYKKNMHTIYSNGIISQRESFGSSNTSGLLRTGRKSSSGKFSYASRRRLRQFIIKHGIPDSYLLGLTLTLPKVDFLKIRGYTYEINNNQTDKNKEQQQVFVKYNECIQRFGIYLSREFPNSGLIWRNELHRRGVPHTHCILHLSVKDYSPIQLFDNTPFQNLFPFHRLSEYFAIEPESKKYFVDLKLKIIDLWIRACSQTVLSSVPVRWRDDLLHRRGFDCRMLVSQQSIVRYIVDDMSKHKQQQLGYIGNQWGVVGRKNFINTQQVTVEGKLAVIFSRLIGKVRRRRVPITSPSLKKRCPFGFKRSKYYPAYSGSTYLTRKTIQQCLEIAKILDQDKKSNS